MPGLNLWLAPRGAGDVEATFRAAQDRLAGPAWSSGSVGPRPEATVIAALGRCAVGAVAWPGYPIRTWADPDQTVILEGQLVDRAADRLGPELVELGRQALRAPDPATVVAPFVRAADGDFLVIVVAGDGSRAIAFGDAFGRLPIYVHAGPRGLILTRHARFAAAVVGDWGFDRLGLAQRLWLGYALGERTIFDGIERGPHGPLIVADAADDAVSVRRSSVYDYRCDRPDRGTPVETAARALADGLIVAAGQRARAAGGGPLLVSMSGGNDSRTVLASLVRAGSVPETVTFRRPGGGGAADARMAERVAAVLETPWSRVDLPPPTPADEAELVWEKEGLNSIGMAFIVPFLHEIVRRWTDRAVLFTGDGGDKIFPDLRPLGRPATLEAGVRAILADAEQLPASVAERVVGLPGGTLVADLRARLDAYPEPRIADKVVRFQIAERARKWLFEGEDRTRAYVWAASPFYARPVVEAALAVPHAAKPDFRFYAAVQAALDPRLVTIPHADFGLAITSGRFAWRARGRRMALRTAGPWIRRLRARGRAEPAPAAARSEALSALDAGIARPGSRLPDALDASAARAAIEAASPSQLDAWRTILLVDRLWAERLGPPR